MEILRFSEPPKRRSGGSRNKKSGFAPAASVVIAVAVMFGMSTTLAGTITLNGGTAVEFGQGVVTAAACDTSLSITPASSYDTSGVFTVSAVTISKVGSSSYAGTGDGCLGKHFTIKAYDSAGSQLNVNPSNNTNYFYVKLPSDTATAGVSDSYTVKSSFTAVLTPTGFSTNPSTNDATGGSFMVSGLKISSSVVRFTIESSDALLGNTN